MNIFKNIEALLGLIVLLVIIFLIHSSYPLNLKKETVYHQNLIHDKQSKRELKKTSTNLIIQKSGPDVVRLEESMSYVLSISNNSNSVSDAIFIDTLPPFVSNVSFGTCTPANGALCPTSSDYSFTTINIGGVDRIILNGTIPVLPSNGQVEMVINLNAPSSLYNGYSFSNTAHIYLPDGTLSSSSTWNITLLNDTDIEVLKTSSIPSGDLGDCSTFPKTIDYTVQWINHGPSNAGGVRIIDSFDFSEIYTGLGNALFGFSFEISDLQWNASSLNTTTPNQYFSITNGPLDLDTQIASNIVSWAVNDTITLTYKLSIQAPIIIGCGKSVQQVINNRAYFEIPLSINLIDINDTNDEAFTLHSLDCSSPDCSITDIEVLKTSNPIQGNLGDCNTFPKIIDYTIQWVNHGPSNADGVEIVDSLIAQETYMGTGNAGFFFPFEITDLQWSTSSSNTTIPNQTFDILNGYSLILTHLTTEVISWKSGDTITLTYKLSMLNPVINGCGKSVSLEIINNADFNIPPSTNLLDTINANDEVQTIHSFECSGPDCLLTDIEVLKTTSLPQGNIGDCNTFPITIDYKIQWINHGPSHADGLKIVDFINTYSAYTGNGNAVFNFPFEITDLQWTASSSNTTTPSQIFDSMSDNSFENILIESEINSWAANDTITLDYKLSIQNPTINGCGRIINFKIRNNAYFEIPYSIQLIDLVSSNNLDGTNHILEIQSIDLSISKSISPTITIHGDIITMTNIFQNSANSADAVNAYWIDTLPNTFDIDLATINCVATGGATCPTVSYDPVTRILRQDFDVFPSGGQVTITFDGTINSTLNIIESTSAYAFADCGIDCVPETNFAETNFQVDTPPCTILNFIRD